MQVLAQEHIYDVCQCLARNSALLYLRTTSKPLHDALLGQIKIHLQSALDTEILSPEEIMPSSLFKKMEISRFQRRLDRLLHLRLRAPAEPVVAAYFETQLRLQLWAGQHNNGLLLQELLETIFRNKGCLFVHLSWPWLKEITLASLGPHWLYDDNCLQIRLRSHRAASLVEVRDMGRSNMKYNLRQVLETCLALARYWDDAEISSSE